MIFRPVKISVAILVFNNFKTNLVTSFTSYEKGSLLTK